jgi:hypothetical protein
LWHVKDPYNGVELAIDGKITGHFFLLGVVVDVGAPGGASGNIRSRVSTISLQAAVHPWASAAWAL